MSDRQGWAPPRDTDGVPLLDTAAAQLITGHKTPEGFNRWARRHHLHPIRRGAHGAHLWRHADILDAHDLPHDGSTI